MEIIELKATATAKTQHKKKNLIKYEKKKSCNSEIDTERGV